MRVGATWIEPSDYQAFMVELLHTPWYLAQKEIQVKYSEVNGEWCGLVIDIENQSKLTDKRIADWCEQLKKEF